MTETPAPCVSPAVLSTADAARYIGMSVPWLKLTRNVGDPSGPPFVKVGRAIRYIRADLDDWLEQHRRAPGKAAA